MRALLAYLTVFLALLLLFLWGHDALNHASFLPVADHLFSIKGWAWLGLRVLVWPGLFAGRMGLWHTWTIVVSALVLSALVARVLTPRVGLAHASASVAATYVLAGVLYLFYLPVPTPSGSLLVAPEQFDTFIKGYEAAYRGAMIDMWVVPDGDFPPALGLGLWSGYLAGTREWQGLIPGVTRGTYAYEHVYLPSCD